MVIVTVFVSQNFAEFVFEIIAFLHSAASIVIFIFVFITLAGLAGFANAAVDNYAIAVDFLKNPRKERCWRT